MTLPDTWHTDLIQYVNNLLGDDVQLETLRGKSGASVWRVRNVQTSIIVKETQRSNEVVFYSHAAPLLTAHQIAIPELKHTVAVPPVHWLVLEDIPDALVVERGQIDKLMITLLARLHSLPVNLVPAETMTFQPSWTDEMTRKAFAVLPQHTHLQAQVESIQTKAQPIFEKQALISGDPNPTNWGVRPDGTRVLFDWERFTCATPAIDLAITVAGLGNPAHFHELATVYLDIRQQIKPYPMPAAQLAQHIAYAKLWTVIEYLTLYADNLIEPDTTLDFIRREFAVWLEGLTSP